MAVTSKWRQHIEAWQHSGLSQAEYCAQQQVNVRTFTARLSEFRKSSKSDSAVLIPVRVESSAAGVMVLSHAQGHRLELPTSVSARWVAELLQCLV